MRHVRGAALSREGGGLKDGQLLEDFVARRDEAAFEALLLRHGPMVLGVCRRVLGNAQDAEDAFQATFLVLVRKAASLLPRETIGNWLYGVAYHSSLKARAAAWKRRARERHAGTMPRCDAATADDRSDLRLLIDRELDRLPDKYREPMVLCELEGRSRKEAARQLGIPEGTLSSRLATARGRLARRLACHRLALGGTAVVGGLLPGAATAGVPIELADSTIRAATAGACSAEVAALTKGVLRAMLLTKLKLVAAALLIAALTGYGVVLLIPASPAAGPARVAGQTAQKPPQAPPSSKEEELKALIERVMKAHGGAAKLAEHPVIRMKIEGKVVAADQNAPFDLVQTYRLPDLYRSEMTVERQGVKTTSIAVLNKDEGWLRLTNGDIQGLNDVGIATTWNSVYNQGVGLVALLNDKRYEVSLLGPTKVRDKEAIGVLVKPQGQGDIKLYFDKASGLLVSEIHMMKPFGAANDSLQQAFFSDYRQKDGISYPQQMDLYFDGMKTIEARVTEVGFSKKVDDKQFTQP
jgi:RNA polymerase sigma factor (sigma-70 family)